MSTLPASLSQLKDIHLPPTVSMWPLAPGYYILLLMLIVLIIGIILLIRRQYRANQLPKKVKQCLANIEHNYQQTQDIHHASQALSILLKRTCLATFDRHTVAGLTGDKWLAFLDKTGQTTDFSCGHGRLLTESPYNPNISGNDQALFLICKQWLKRNTR